MNDLLEARLAILGDRIKTETERPLAESREVLRDLNTRLALLLVE